jgi:hypothetical protein
MKIDLQPTFDAATNTITVAGATMVFHCHHYNGHLQRNLENSGFVDAPSVIARSVAKSIDSAIKNHVATHPELDTPQGKLQVATEMAKTFGYGALDLSQLNESGGTAWANSSHFATGWLVKWGQRETPGCYFIAGYIAGALAAAYNKPLDYYQVQETECIAVGAKKCKFVVGGK